MNIKNLLLKPKEQMLYKEKVIFIAGFFDGEGCITIGKNGSISANTINTSINNLRLIQEIFGGTISKRLQKVNKIQYSHRLYGINAVSFLLEIKDYLIDKKEQAESALLYYNKSGELKTISLPNRKGRFSNPNRQILINEYRNILSQQKLKDQD